MTTPVIEVGKSFRGPGTAWTDEGARRAEA